jgi:hypothetical protein
MTKPWTSADEDREWHAATSLEQCDGIESALRDQGLDITLVDRQATSNSILRAACIFDGPDADPEAERWTSYQETD